MQRPRFVGFAILLTFTLLLAACAPAATPAPQAQEPAPTDTPAPPPTDTPAPPPTDTPEPPTPTPEPEMSEAEKAAVQLWEELQAANYQENWATVPGKGTLYRGQGPHGMLLSTYLNESAAGAMESKPGVMPDDAIIVKENYMPDETLAAITVMMKKPGFDENHSDWFWAKFGPDGTIQAAGKPVGCIACHGSVRSNNYIFTFPIAPIAAPAVDTTDEITAMAEQLWEELQAANYQENWATVPGKGTLYRGQGPHGMLLSTYLNESAAGAMESKPGVMPDDAIIVKENYMPDETLAAITVMMKKPGFDENHSDWFWAKFGPDGTIQAAGKPVGCIACHGSVRSNNYIFTFPIAPIPPEGPPPEVMTPGGTGEESAMEGGKEEKEGMAEEIPPAPDQETAVALINKGGCAGCHTIAGVEGAMGSLGPPWCVPAQKVQSGAENLDYLRTAIVDPNAVIAEGFPANIMPQNFGELFTPEEVETLVAFIANLQCEGES